MLFSFKSSGLYTESQELSFPKFTLDRLYYFPREILLLKSMVDFLSQYSIPMFFLKCGIGISPRRGEFFIPTADCGLILVTRF